jgi:hypothetical protein
MVAKIKVFLQVELRKPGTRAEEEGGLVGGRDVRVVGLGVGMEW